MQLIYYSIDKDKRKNGKKHNSIPEGITLTKIWLTLENNDHVCFTPILLPKLEMEIPAFWKCHNICNIKQQKCCEKSFLQGSSPHCFSIRSKMWFNSYKSYHNGRVSWQNFLVEFTHHIFSRITYEDWEKINRRIVCFNLL